jgi:hypothetical protein
MALKPGDKFPDNVVFQCVSLPPTNPTIAI